MVESGKASGHKADTSLARPHGSPSDTAWHTRDASEVLSALGVDTSTGLSTAQAAERRQQFGPNAMAAGAVESRLHAFLRQYADPMQIVLLVAGVVSLYPLKELETGLILVALTLFNAVLGLQQEGKAAAAVAALQQMMIVTARVMRDGELAADPGRAAGARRHRGDRGRRRRAGRRRLLRAATLEVAESALTGESLPVVQGRRAGRRTRTRRWVTGPTWCT